jgi:predicted transposase YdaD
VWVEGREERMVQDGETEGRTEGRKEGIDFLAFLQVN